MHEEILAPSQKNLLPLVKKFNKQFGLVGGTAIALQLGHRRSIDFDLFSLANFDNLKIRKTIVDSKGKIGEVLIKEEGQYTMKVSGVQMTFFLYPFPIEFSEDFKDIIKMPDLLTLAAMKTYALGRRGKWKDYVDLYFIIRQHSLEAILKKAKDIFGAEFNQRIFREQLSYFADINYSEEIEFMPGYEVSEKDVKKELLNISLS